MQGTQRDVIDTSLDNMLSSVDPKVADLLKEKYEKDAQEFSEAAQDAAPSNQPGYWAKKSCNRCFGSGIMGTKHVFSPGTSAKMVRDEDGNKKYDNCSFQLSVRCSCSENRYGRWLKEFRKFYNALKEQMKEEETNNES